MMNNLVVKISLIVLLVQAFGFAQGEFNTINHDSYVMLKSEAKKTLEKEYFLDDNWTNCIMYLKGNEKSVDYAGRLDYYNKTIDLNISGNERSVRMTELDSFSIGNKRYYSSQVFGSDDDNFLELIEEGKVSLLKSYKIKIKRANYNKVTRTGSKEDSYMVSENFFLLSSDKLVSKIPTKSKSFYKVLSQFPGANDVARSKSLKPDNIDDLVLLVNHLNKN